MRNFEQEPDEIRWEPRITVGEAACMLQLAPQTIRDMIHAKKIPAERIGRKWRIKVTDLEKVLMVA